MIARWLQKLAEESEVTLTEIVPPGGASPLIFGSNGTLFVDEVGHEDYDHPLVRQGIRYFFRGGFADPTSVFYADPYYD